jgi:diketogulonate reductase-like aldo/keto reductase
MKSKLSRRAFTSQLCTVAAGTLMLPAAAANLFASAIALPANNIMLKRKIPSSGELLPVVGIGTWLQFDVSDNSAEKSELLKVLSTMLEKGGTVIDCSPMYGNAESIVGELSQQTAKPDQFFYATKVWTTGKEKGVRQMQESLIKMKRKKIDLMQVHNLQDWQTHLGTIKEWKKDGLIRYSGITHYTASAHSSIEKIVKSEKPDFAQFNYSMRELNAEQSLLKTCIDNGVAVIINEPYEKGSLFSLTKGKPLPAWAAEYSISSWGQFFLKYIISHPAVNCVIPGTSNPKHVADNIGAGYGEMPDEKGRKKMLEYLNRL